MFEMKCKKCGAPAVSVEPDKIDQMLHGTGPYSGVSAAFFRAPPPVKMARLALIGCREIYKRIPGGGAKRCTSKVCGHKFS